MPRRQDFRGRLGAQWQPKALPSSLCPAETQSYQVFALRTCYQFMSNYCYVVLDRSSGEAAVVDPAWELVTLQGKLLEIGARLTTILLTHSHYDHVNLVACLVRDYDATVVLSRQEKECYRFSCDNLVLAEHLDRILVGKTAMTCLLTPGHTAGSMCYLLPNSIFTGDTLFIEGCGICNAEGGSPQEMFKSIQSIKQMVHPDVRVYPGHSYGRAPGCSFAEVQKENIYLQIDREDIFVEFRMRKGQRNLFDFR